MEITRRQALQALLLTPGAGPDYLFLDIGARRSLNGNWPDSNAPFHPGSLLKPFLALAYGDSGNLRFPTVNCSRCWKPGGHGLLALQDAIALSCNTYFLYLARHCRPGAITRTAEVYGLPATAADTWVGLDPALQITANSMLNAYAELALRRSDPGPARVLAGMRQSAQRGTGRAVGIPAYTKTGTGPCRHLSSGSGDGYAVALFPLDSPRYVLLAALHNHPGSEAARSAGNLIRRFTPASARYTELGTSAGFSSRLLPRRAGTPTLSDPTATRVSADN